MDYLIDKSGNIAYFHNCEGDYCEAGTGGTIGLIAPEVWQF